MKVRKKDKLKRSSRKMCRKKGHSGSRGISSEHKLKIELELSKKGYIYGTARELSECLKVPLKVIYRLIKDKKNFISDKIKSGNCTYYIIKKAKD